MTHVLYLTHDLNDAATWRRVAMLRDGGARVTVAGFHRGEPGAGDGETPVIVLGHTFNGRMGQRVAAVARAALGLRAAFAGVAAPDVVLARNLETLALAPRLRRLFAPARPALVYECLDIHRLMLGDGPAARTLRAAERALLARADLILTSSPAFVRHYFRPLAQSRVPIRVVENRTAPAPLPAGLPPAPGPFRIAWFGMLRCRASLHCLDAATRAMPGHVRVMLRGRPALDAVPEFHDVVAANPDLAFGGPYRPEDLPALYGQAHYAWLIDRYEAGQNSDWLLPNRLYEGGAHGAVPIALRGTETASFLVRRGLGIRLDAATPEAVTRAFTALTEADWSAQRAALLAEPRTTWSYSRADCTALVAELAGLGPAAPPARRKPAPNPREVTL